MKVTLFDAHGHRDIDTPDWQTLLATETGTLWVDMTGPTDADVQIMSEVFQFHPLAIEDTRNQEQRPKIEEYAGYLFIILNPGNSGPEGPEFHELDVFVGHNYVVTVHADGAQVIEQTRRRLSQAGPVPAMSPSYLLYVLMDVAVDSYFPLLDNVAEEIEQLEDDVLVEPRQEMLARLFRLKRTLIEMWRVVWPQRDILNNLVHHNPLFMDREALHYYLRDVADHLMWIADMINTFRDTLTGIMDLYMSAVSNRLNVVVNRLTVLTLIIGAMTVIGGFYGMNFAQTWPPFGQAWGVPFVLGLMVVVTGALLVLFRRLGWY